MNRLETKAQMYQAYHRGAFGNRLLAWPTLEAYRASGYANPIVLRYSGKSGGAWCEYNLAPENIDAVVARWVSEGADPCKITVNESANDSALILQGEVMRSIEYLSLRYSTVPKPMRLALAECQHHVGGLQARLLLEATLDDPSMDDLNRLLDDYEGAVVEFSTWDRPVGVYTRNTVFWEVRHY